MADQHDAAMMENLYWWGIPTLFRAQNASVDGTDIALVGVPHSAGNGTTERDQHLGPRAVRNISAVHRRVHGTFDIDPWSMANILLSTTWPRVFLFFFIQEGLQILYNESVLCACRCHFYACELDFVVRGFAYCLSDFVGRQTSH